jgi:hypothetical protein
VSEELLDTQKKCQALGNPYEVPGALIDTQKKCQALLVTH